MGSRNCQHDPGTVKEDSPSLRWTHCCRPLNSKCADQHNLLRSQGSVSAQQLLQFNSNTSCHVRQLGFHLGSHLWRPDLVLQGILLLLCRALECCNVATLSLHLGHPRRTTENLGVSGSNWGE